MCPYARVNSSVFNSRLNIVNDVDDLQSKGKEFQITGAPMLNDLDAVANLTNG